MVDLWLDERELRLLFQIDFKNVNLLELGIEHSLDHHATAFEAVHQVGAVEPVHVVASRQDEIAAEMFDVPRGSRVVRKRQ